MAYDGSDHAKKAVEHAVSLARILNSSLYIITVAVGPSQEALEKAKRIAAEAAEKIASSGLTVSDLAVRSGVPANEILSYAEEIRADLIVMSSRGLSTIQRLVLGSVSQTVASRARVPVLIAK